MAPEGGQPVRLLNSAALLLRRTPTGRPLKPRVPPRRPVQVGLPALALADTTLIKTTEEPDLIHTAGFWGTGVYGVKVLPWS
jgi:hypothetical protein